ncbi:hypothetical protein HYPSUDRAFT_894987 [Hypholoma sublateritium FD-334 SS-4]|uniref:F-box domain-containing protein n=1 Tax=Hypholoma sublateritium (strain FD-334 SS-4) TaxID=945553 RepID=A0A0D2NK83_HYPSF|nr:hypothetical protein HYPSUDRAFT_894987 [Hypholoma sublateritium FD-334 SS-4]
MSSLSFPENLHGAPSDEDRKDSRLAAEHESRIGVLNGQIATLEAEKAALLLALAPLKRDNPPLHRLPDDVLRAIFVECLDCTRNPTMARTDAPVLLTRISSYTRRVALAAPELWAALHIPIMTPSRRSDDGSTEVMAARVRGVEEWLLRRAASMPLSITVHEPWSGDDDPPEAGFNNPFTHWVVTVLLRCCARWRDVSFLLVSVSAVHRIAALTAANCPVLRSVSLHGRRAGFSQGAKAWKNSRLFSGPALQKFSTTLIERGNGTRLYNFDIRWANITHLCLRGVFKGRQHSNDTQFHQVSTTTLRAILRQATRLVSLDTAVVSTIDAGGAIPLPFLTALTVSEEYDKDYRGGILEHIRAPHLETVSYTMQLERPIPPPSLTAVLTHATEVQELSLSLSHKADAAPHASVYRPILALCPCLKALHIGGWRKTLALDLLSDLSGDLAAGGTPLCPVLEHFRCDSTLVVSPAALYAFLQGQRADGTRWKSVALHVCFRDADAVPDYAEFWRLSEAPGVSLRLATQYSGAKRLIMRPLDEGAAFLWDNWEPTRLPRPLHAGFDCVMDV